MNLLRISLNISNKFFSKNYIQRFHIQKCKNLTTSSDKSVGSNENEFELIYSLPQITSIYYLHRLKIYSIMLTSFSAPTSAILWSSNICSKDYFIATACVGNNILNIYI